MGTLYLVRHGQASYGAADYDQLSPRGALQARRLGSFWRAHGQRFDAVLTGTLRRHAQTLREMAGELAEMPEAVQLPALDEYDGLALVRALDPAFAGQVDTPEGFRAYFRLLCDALAQWMAGTISPRGMPDWQDFSDGIRAALDELHRTHQGHQVLVVSSGGPIATAIAQVLGVTPEVGIALNMRLRNSSVSELDMGKRRLALQTFNTVAHLAAPEDAGLQTYA